MIFKLPEAGMRRSARIHRSDMGIFVDWLECNVVFLGRRLSGADIVDILQENNIYRDQDHAWEFFYQALSVMENRARYLGMGYPISLHSDAISFNRNWEDFAPYSFCLFLSLSQVYPNWKHQILLGNYTVQGDLFELLSAEALKQLFGGWVVKNTGWSRTRIVSLNSVVKNVGEWLNEQIGDLGRWTSERAKEAGLDLLSYRPFADANVGIPVYMWQCASGEKWRDKRKTPDIALWSRLLAWAVNPRKGMTIPFALDENSMRKESVIVEGLLLDRHRLLEPGVRNANWLTPSLYDTITNWMTPIVAGLPLLDDNPV